jgi:hypothetical protein
MTLSPIRHGTTDGYCNHKCRCQECRQAWAAYKTRYRDRYLTGECQTPGCTRRVSRAAGTGLCDPCSTASRERGKG